MEYYCDDIELLITTIFEPFDTVICFIFFILFRDTYRNFLARLETGFGVSQRGVKIVAGEMCELSNRVLSHCMKRVCEHLGKWFGIVID